MGNPEFIAAIIAARRPAAMALAITLAEMAARLIPEQLNPSKKEAADGRTA